MPTLTSGIVACSMPEGELVTAIYPAMGKFMVIGTNRGVRIGEIDDSGDITYGPLTIDLNLTGASDIISHHSLAARDRFAFVGIGNAGLGSAVVCIWRIDLSRPKADGTFPSATDLKPSNSAGTYANHQRYSIGQVGSTGRLWCASGDGIAAGVYVESSTVKELSGTLETGQIRFNTTENKRFKFLKTQTNNQPGAIQLDVRPGSSGSYTQVANVAANTATGNADIDLARAAPEEMLGIRFTLNRSAATTSGPTIESYQVKALPAAPRQREFTVPILLFKEMADHKGAKLPPVDTRAVVSALETFENNQDTVSFQELAAGVTTQCTVQKVEYVSSSSPGPNAKGEGGILYLTLRTIA